MKQPIPDFTWGNHVLTNAELEMVILALEELIVNKSEAKLDAFKDIMIARHGVPYKSMSFMMDQPRSGQKKTLYNRRNSSRKK